MELVRKTHHCVFEMFLTVFQILPEWHASLTAAESFPSRNLPNGWKLDRLVKFWNLWVIGIRMLSNRREMKPFVVFFAFTLLSSGFTETSRDHRKGILFFIQSRYRQQEDCSTTSGLNPGIAQYSPQSNFGESGSLIFDGNGYQRARGDDCPTGEARNTPIFDPPYGYGASMYDNVARANTFSARKGMNLKSKPSFNARCGYARSTPEWNSAIVCVLLCCSAPTSRASGTPRSRNIISEKREAKQLADARAMDSAENSRMGDSRSSLNHEQVLRNLFLFVVLLHGILFDVYFRVLCLQQDSLRLVCQLWLHYLASYCFRSTCKEQRTIATSSWFGWVKNFILPGEHNTNE